MTREKLKSLSRIFESMDCLEVAMANCKTVSPFLSKAIAMTKRSPGLCEKISWWKEGLWELIEEFLNGNPQDVDPELFIQGCALLEYSQELEEL